MKFSTKKPQNVYGDGIIVLPEKRQTVIDQMAHI